MPDLPTGTVTFLYTDIEGSTRRWERDVRALRAQLDSATLTAAWAAGRAMALDEAIAYALEESTDG